MKLPYKYERELQRFTSAVKTQLHENIYSIILYGSAVRGDLVAGVSDINVLIILRESTPEAHHVIADCLKGEIDINPFIITQRGMARSIHAFALKFASIQRNYRVLAGHDPFEDYSIDDHVLRFSTEQSLRNLRLRCVRAFVLSYRDTKAYAKYLHGVIPKVFVDLSQILRLEGETLSRDFSQRIKPISDLLDIDAAFLQRLLDYKENPHKLRKSEITDVHGQLFRTLDKTLQWVEAKWPQQ